MVEKHVDDKTTVRFDDPKYQRISYPSLDKHMFIRDEVPTFWSHTWGPLVSFAAAFWKETRGRHVLVKKENHTPHWDIGFVLGLISIQGAVTRTRYMVLIDGDRRPKIYNITRLRFFPNPPFVQSGNFYSVNNPVP